MSEVEKIMEMARDFSNATDAKDAFDAEYSLRKAVEALVADRDKLKAELEKLQDRDPVSRDNGVKMTEVEKIMSLADEYGACHGDIDHDGENWIDLWVEPRKKLQEAVEELVKGRDGWKKEALHHAQQHSYYKQRTVDIEAGAKALVQERDTLKTAIENMEKVNRVIARMEDEARAQVQQEPQEALFLLHTGKFYDGEQDEWEIEADSYNTVSAFCHAHPEQTIGLYAAPVNDKLREAAQAMVKAFQPGKPSEFAYIARDKLREALEAMK